MVHRLFELPEIAVELCATGLQELRHTVAGLSRLDEVLLNGRYYLRESAVAHHHRHLGRRRDRGGGVPSLRPLLPPRLQRHGGVLRWRRPPVLRSGHEPALRSGREPALRSGPHLPILLRSGLRRSRGRVVLVVVHPSAAMHPLPFLLLLLLAVVNLVFFFEAVGVVVVEVGPGLLFLLELAEAVGLLDVGLAPVEELGVRRRRRVEVLPVPRRRGGRRPHRWLLAERRLRGARHARVRQDVRNPEPPHAWSPHRRSLRRRWRRRVRVRVLGERRRWRERG
uniref:Uncharacterized protein n=1 Tax=Arundo donax TaxID=35708 RepID=A0A0A9CRT0_ARUDO